MVFIVDYKLSYKLKTIHFKTYFCRNVFYTRCIWSCLCANLKVIKDSGSSSEAVLDIEHLLSRIMYAFSIISYTSQNNFKRFPGY